MPTEFRITPTGETVTITRLTPTATDRPSTFEIDADELAKLAETLAPYLFSEIPDNAARVAYFPPGVPVTLFGAALTGTYPPHWVPSVTETPTGRGAVLYAIPDDA